MCGERRRRAVSRHDVTSGRLCKPRSRCRPCTDCNGCVRCSAWTMALQDARINTVSLNETSRRSSGSSCSAFTRGVLLSWFQVVSTPQVTFAQEVRPSAPPPYSDYAPPPQVRGLTCMNVSSCTHTIYTRYRRGHVEESAVVSDTFTWITCAGTSTTRSFVSIATGRGLMVSLAVPSPLSRSSLRPRTGTSWRPPRRTPPRSCTRPTGSPTPWPTPTSTQVRGGGGLGPQGGASTIHLLPKYIYIFQCMETVSRLLLLIGHYYPPSLTPPPGVYGGPGANGGVMRERQWEDGGDVALGMLAGAATGLAIGSLFAVF